MKNSKLIIIASSTLVIGLLLGWLIFGGVSGSPEEEHIDIGEEAVTTWTCSMHPQIRQNEPGNCPICGMELIPVDDGTEIDPQTVNMSPTAILLADIRTAKVGSVEPVKTVRLSGKVEVDERQIYSQSSHIPGRIERLTVNFTGEYIRRGQTIAFVYSPELVTAQDELFIAESIRDTRPQLYEAAREKLKNWKLTDKKIDEIIEQGKPVNEFPVIADVSGFVTEKKVNRGDYISKGQAIYEVVDLSKVWILFDVYESEMSWIKIGDEVEFSVGSLPGETFKGKISYLDPVINPKTRVAKARVEVVNRGNKLKPEMFASGLVEASLENQTDKPVIPKTAVLWTGTRSVVYVRTESPSGLSFKMREVTLGPSLGDGYIIEDGLQVGEEISVNGTFSIDAAAQLAGKPSMMSPEGGSVNTGHQHGEMQGQSGEMDSKTGVSNVQIGVEARSAIQPVIKNYLDLKNALVEDDFEKAQKMSVSLKKSVENVEMSVFEGEAHITWMENRNKLSDLLQHAEHHTDIESLRKVFQSVSEQVIALTNTFRPLNDTLYIQFCPMANQSRGAYWLSEEKEVKNPYYGESMLTCGETKSEVK